MEHLQEEFNGGPDYTFECVGNVHVMRQALESCHKGKLEVLSSAWNKFSSFIIWAWGSDAFKHETRSSRF